MIGQMQNIHGLQIISSPLVPETESKQYRKPKTKRSRVQKKWRKMQSNWHDVMPFYKFGGKMAAHPNNIRKLQQAL